MADTALVLPLRVNSNNRLNQPCIYSANHDLIAECSTFQAATAIVNAVNGYGKMRVALAPFASGSADISGTAVILDEVDAGEAINAARAALKGE